MFVMASPGLLLFSLLFGAVGLFIGIWPFVGGAVIGLLAGFAGLIFGHVKLRRDARLDASGVTVQAGHLKRERASIQLWGTTPVRVVCVGESPEPYRGAVFRSDWFVDPRGGFEDMPDHITVMVAPGHPDRYHVDLRSFEIQRHFGWHALWVPAAMIAMALPAIIFGTLSVGEGPQALRPPMAQGMVSASGHALGQWSF
jgi:hypothetical protein